MELGREKRRIFANRAFVSVTGWWLSLVGNEYVKKSVHCKTVIAPPLCALSTLPTCLLEGTLP